MLVEPTSADVPETSQVTGYQLVIVMVDLHGGGRERIYVAPVERSFFCETVLLHNAHGDTVGLAGFGEDVGHKNIEVMPETPRDWLNKTKLSLVTLRQSDNQRHPLCVRSQLQDSVSALRADGWKANIGLELEFFVSGASESVLDTSSMRDFYGTLFDGSPVAQFGQEVVFKTRSLGIKIESVYREYESRQLEITAPPLEPIEAADNGFLLKYLVRSIASCKGILIDMRPQPLPEIFGNGLHINISLEAAGSGETWDLDMAKQVAARIGPELAKSCLLFVPTENGYERLQNPEYRSLTRDWACERRDTFIRITGRNQSLRLELRLPDPTCNVHLAVAAALELVRHAIRDIQEGNEMAVLSFPRSLEEAIRLLEGPGVITRAFPSELIDALLAIKRTECS